MRNWIIVSCSLWLLGCGGGGSESSPPPVSSTTPPIVNLAPTADAGADQQVAGASLVLLNGSGKDPENGPLTYLWRQISGTSVVLNNATSANASFSAPIAPTAQQLSFELQVTDQGGLTAKDTVLIQVAATEPVLTAAGAARLLQQASFGPTSVDIQAATGLTVKRWLELQMALPATTHMDKVANVVGQDMPAPLTRLETWWQISLTAPDQLRQRVAFALSEIMVVSDLGNGLNNQPLALANYYDLLLKNAFGNYRTLLEQVTLSPVMGVYLSHFGNQKADVEKNIRPDENYAREVMQLFSIGLQQLNIDGSWQLDSKGQPIATYDQNVIEGFARVFTGWTSNGTVRFDRPRNDFIQPMINFATMHETGTKQLLNGVTLPAGQTAQKDLADALDNLANHPNVGPFISKQLIQRLVTSNPSPAYVTRVSQKFANNGQGVRGDLAAVVSAILLDEEARSGFSGISIPFGKLREPLLKTSHAFRILNSASSSGHIYLFNLVDSHGQAPLQAGSVFNFFRPDYAPTTAMQQLGMVAPELQMLTDSNALNMQNFMYLQTWQSIFGQVSNPNQYQLLARFAPYANMLTSQGANALLDQYSLLCFASAMPADLRQLLLDLISGLSTSYNAEQQAAAALYFILISPHYAVQL